MKRLALSLALLFLPSLALAQCTVRTQSYRIGVNGTELVKQSQKTFNHLQDAQCGSLYAQNTSSLNTWIMNHPHDFDTPVTWKFKQKVNAGQYFEIAAHTVYGEWHAADTEAMYEAFIEAQWYACD